MRIALNEALPWEINYTERIFSHFYLSRNKKHIFAKTDGFLQLLLNEFLHGLISSSFTVQICT